MRRIARGTLGTALVLLPLACTEPNGASGIGEARQGLCYGHYIANVVADTTTFHWEGAAHLLESAEGFGPRTLDLHVSTSVTPSVHVSGTLTPKDSEISDAVGYDVSFSYSLESSSSVFVPYEGYARLEAYAAYLRTSWDILGTDCWGPGSYVLGGGVSFKPIGVYFKTCQTLLDCSIEGPIGGEPIPAAVELPVYTAAADADAGHP